MCKILKPMRASNMPKTKADDMSLVHDLRTAQAVCCAGRAAALNNSYTPLESNTLLASAIQSSSF